MKYRYSSMLLLGLTLAAPQAHAQVDPMIEGAKMCTRHLTRYEREYGIPTHLLSAISSIESGRYHKGLKIRLPWPWAVNVEGKGYMFDSKAEAMAAVRKFRSQGARSIDVGCMQVNLVHHADAFASLDEAFDPEHNVAYAASFLRSLYQEEGSWKKAAADYHSKTPGRGSQYAGMVYNSWHGIIDKLRNARLQTAGEPQQVAAYEKPQTFTPPQKSAMVVARETPVASARTAASGRVHMRSISVSSARGDDALVVDARPRTMQEAAKAPETITITPRSQTAPVASRSAFVQPKTLLVAQATHDDGPKVIHVEPRTPAVSSRQSGPNFIFRD